MLFLSSVQCFVALKSMQSLFEHLMSIWHSKKLRKNSFGMYVLTSDSRIFVLMSPVGIRYELESMLGVNFRAANSSPLLPTSIGSFCDLPLSWYCFATLTTKRRLLLYSSLRASMSPCLILSASVPPCSIVSSSFLVTSSKNDYTDWLLRIVIFILIVIVCFESKLFLYQTKFRKALSE